MKMLLNEVIFGKIPQKTLKFLCRDFVPLKSLKIKKPFLLKKYSSIKNDNSICRNIVFLGEH